MSNDPHLDDTIRQAYRAAAQTEPGPQLDARILQAAHAALKTPKQTPVHKPARWSWLVLPFSAAAVAILVTTLVLEFRPTPSTQPLESASAPPTSAMKPEVAAAPATQPPEQPIAAVQPEKKAPRPAAPASRNARQDQAARIASAETALLEQRRQASEKMAAAPPLARSVESAPRPTPSPVQPPEDADAAAVGSSAAAAAEPRPPEAKREAFSPQAKARSPETPTDKQLEDIRKLQREGKLEAAKKALAELRKQFPHYKVPEDLRGLIEPATEMEK